MNITYENHGDYYTFSHQPDTRVYLGDADPNDYIHDVINQKKRTESCYYYEISTGKKVDYDNIPDEESIHFNNSDPYPLKENCKYGFKCDYDFKRKLSLAHYSIAGRNVKYIQKDKAIERLATAYAFNKTLEEYDAWTEEFNRKQEKFKRENPSLHNLMGVDGRMYYTDDNGKEITIEEHQTRMKAELGEDCFEQEARRLGITKE